MATCDGALEYIMDLLGPVEPEAKRMFGGLGIFHRGLIFALMGDYTLYMKVDDLNRADFEAEGSGPFSIAMKGKEMTMSYYEVPADVLEDPDILNEWANKAIDLSLRADAAKPVSKQKIK
jgi:DNA transformation protein